MTSAEPTPDTYQTGAVKQDEGTLAVAVRTNILDADNLKDWGVMTIDRGGHYASWAEVQNWKDMEQKMNAANGAGQMTPMTAPNPDSPEYRITELERKLDAVIWLHAELVYALRLAAATQYAQTLQPQMQQQIVEQIMAGQSP